MQNIYQINFISKGTNAFPSTFTIYKECVETKNANKPHVFGMLYPTTLQAFPKNPNIAQMFTQMGRSEELGTGIRNVYKYSKAYSGSDKIVFSEEDVFISKVPLQSLYLENGGLNGGLNEGQQKLIKIIQESEAGTPLCHIHQTKAELMQKAA